MSKLPVVAIIGSPNTGKSTLFNRVIGQRRAIESEVPGTTRDHIAQKIETEEVDYLLLDTGGMGGGTSDKDFEDDVEEQSMLAVDAADLIILTIDSREELTKSDREVIAILRKRKRRHVPVILVATKCDNLLKADEIIAELHALRIGDEVLAVSAAHNMGTDELSEKIAEHLSKLHFSKPNEAKEANEANEAPRIAIVGKPNVGKSSLINALMSDPQRKISPRLVSEIPGTTRDTTDTVIRHEDQEFIFIDTAGLKRNAKTKEGIEHYAMLRTITALQETDVAVLLIDGQEPISNQDKRIAKLAIEAGAGLIIVINKIDVLTKEQREQRENEIECEMRYCQFASVLSCSTVSRINLAKLFPLIALVSRNRARRIPDKELHRWLSDALGRRGQTALRTCKHITQADALPPTFVLFVRDPKNVLLSELRYLENAMRKTFGFEGTPIRWITKGGSQR